MFGVCSTLGRPLAEPDKHVSPWLARVCYALILMLLLSSCGPVQHNLHPEEAFPTTAWLTDDEPKAVILALHGFNDYRTGYAAFGSYAADRGFDVFAYDQAGFGERPDPGRWPGIEKLNADLRMEIRRLNTTYPDLPLIVLGVSMGATVAILGTTTNAVAADMPEPRVDGIILAAPAVWGDARLNPIYQAVLWTTTQVAPGWRLTGRGLSFLPTDNMDALRQLSDDPLVIKATRVDALMGLVRLMNAVRDLESQIDRPVLILRGERDELVPATSVESFATGVSTEYCWFARYPDGWHMLLRDLQAEIVWQDILAWIERRSIPSGNGSRCSTENTTHASD